MKLHNNYVVVDGILLDGFYFSLGENSSQGHHTRECVVGMKTNFFTEALKLPL